MSNFLYSVAEKLREKNIEKKLRELQETQYCSVQELNDYEKEKLKVLLST